MTERNRMRIGLVAAPALPVVTDMDGYGGTERVVAELAKTLANRGHDVTLFAPEGSRVSAEPDAKLRIVPTVKYLWRKEKRKELQTDREKEAEAKRQQIEKEKGIKKTLDMVYDKYRKKEFDVVHFHLDEAMLDKRFDRLPTPVVNTIHGDTALANLQEMYAKSDNRSVVFISKSQRNFMPKANSAGIVYNGVDPQKFLPEYAPGDYLTFLGRASPDKGMHAAMDLAYQTNIPLKAVFRMPLETRDKYSKVDWQYYETEIEPRFKKYGSLVERIVDPPRKIRDEVLRGGLAILGLSGFPPSTWNEPFGLFLIESMASGTPAVIYRKGGPAEIVTHGLTGFVASAKDEKTAMNEMGAGIQNVKASGSYLRVMARIEVENRFSSEEMAKGYEQVYKRLINGKGLLRIELNQPANLIRR